MSAPLVGHSSKKKCHSKIGSLLWNWSNLFHPSGVPVEVVFEGGGPGRRSMNGSLFASESSSLSPSHLKRLPWRASYSWGLRRLECRLIPVVGNSSGSCLRSIPIWTLASWWWWWCYVWQCWESKNAPNLAAWNVSSELLGARPGGWWPCFCEFDVFPLPLPTLEGGYELRQQILFHCSCSRLIRQLSIVGVFCSICWQD
jgi:hypothetical protein